MLVVKRLGECLIYQSNVLIVAQFEYNTKEQWQGPVLVVQCSIVLTVMMFLFFASNNFYSMMDASIQLDGFV
jgi:hypothetical protein